jgi:hypothetical protein
MNKKLAPKNKVGYAHFNTLQKTALIKQLWLV